MVLKEVQPTNVIPPASTLGIYSSVSAQPITHTSFQAMESSLRMESSLGLQPPSQTLCLPQTPEFPKACSSRNIQTLESNPPAALGDISMVAPVQSSSNLLALAPSPSQEQKENNDMDDIKASLPKLLDTNQKPTENQDSPLLPLEAPDIRQLQACIDPLGPEKQPGCENAGLRENSLSLKNQRTQESGTESNDGSADIATLVEDIHLPQILHPLDDLDQSKGPKVIKNKDTRAIKLKQVQKESSIMKAPSDQARKNKHRASEPISDAPKAKIKPRIKPKIKPESPDCVCLGEVGICNAAASDRAPASTARHSNSKPQKAASSRNRATKSHGQEKNKRNKDNSKKAEESKQSGNNNKDEEKPSIPKVKRKKNQPELTQETFKKPRTCLGMYMYESAQVIHALGKKSDKKIELSSSRALGNSSNLKGPQPGPAVTRWLDATHKGKGPEKIQVKHQKTNGSAEKECSSPSEYELPPPGKVKLVPLPFLNLDKPQARPVPRRPPSLAQRRPAVANPARPASNSGQPTAVNSSRPTPAPLTGPTRPAQPTSSNPSRPALISPARPASNSGQPTALNSSQPIPASSTGPARSARPTSSKRSRPALTSPARPGSNSAQPAALNSSQPIPASSTGPVRPACTTANNPCRPRLTNPTRPNVTQSAAPSPVTYKTSACTSFQQPILTAVTKPQSPPKPQNQYLLQDFALQPIPWKKPNVSGPAMSKPITEEQRPEREAMKRMAQLERDKAAKYSLEKVQDFLKREKEMETSQYYSYAI